MTASEYPDLAAVDKMVHEACAQEGFTFTHTPSGEERIDEEALKHAVYLEMMENHVVADRKALTKGAVTDEELFEAIFKSGLRNPKTLEERTARTQLKRKLWNWTSSGTTGHVNKRVELEGETLVMCEAKVARSYRSRETGGNKPTTEVGRFLTNSGELILEYSTLGKTTKLVKAAEAVAKHLAMTTRRHPELAGKVASQLSAAVKQTQAALLPVSTGKAQASPPNVRSDEGDSA